MASFYESDGALEQYLLFHYGTPEQICPLLPEARGACGFPARCVTEPLKGLALANRRRALDLGCAVGGSSLVLSGLFEEVVGIDFSARFIAAARAMQTQGEATVSVAREGGLRDELHLTLAPALTTKHVHFEQGDACNLRADLGTFDLILMANLIDRLPNPRACLARLPELCAPGGAVVITSPYTWLEEYTPRDKWLDQGRGTLEALREILTPHFHFQRALDLPFLIREHRRKFQWSIADASVWMRRV